MIEALTSFPLTAEKIAAMTCADPILSRVYEAVQQGKLRELTEKDFTTYRKKGTEMSTQRRCVIWGSRVVIPALARSEAMNLVHAGHKGIVAMRSSARSYVWWPGIDRDIEKAVGSCPICQESKLQQIWPMTNRYVPSIPHEYIQI